MKVLITENKVFNVIYNYIDKKFDRDEINWVYGPNDDEDNEDFLIFYKGNWAGEDYSDIVFYYFTADYYSDEPSGILFKKASPILDVLEEYGEKLDSMFGKHWREPMKKWFEDKFNLPVKTINTFY